MGLFFKKKKIVLGLFIPFLDIVKILKREREGGHDDKAQEHHHKEEEEEDNA